MKETEKVHDVNFQEIAKVLFNEVERLNNIINEAIDYLENLECEEFTTILLKEKNYSTKQNFVNDLLDILKGSDSK